ncbi:MAG: AAA family ATPase [Solirubrobacterales bacterium]|nr:AAA family ATPase [Solirubrobacterales bacterium]
MHQDLVQALEEDTHELSVEVRADGSLNVQHCPPAFVSFRAYEPEDLGIIEYHSASRTYTRQPVQGINLDPQSFEDQRRTQSLYNWQGKYQNVKTELASGYLRALVARQSGQEPEGEDLNETLMELFRTFFPDKVYEGVQPTPSGGLEFPVRLPGGETHDIDEMSSGEKEILYGYLRLRNSTPRGSVILLDEPELHLNPSLLQGFADFYYRHLGVAQGNQLWMVTHSDTLLRQALGNTNYRIYHMLGASTSAGNQASEVLLDDDLERVVVDLVGDLAGYRPHAKVVVLEGSSEDGFDERVVRRLFPEVAKRVNLVSGGPKRRVRDLYRVLNDAATTAGLSNRFFAITDKDSETHATAEMPTQEFSWPVYHIENFLLEPTAIRRACVSLLGSDPFDSDQRVLDALKDSAEELVDSLVLERLRTEANNELVNAINVAGDPESSDPARALLPAISASVERVKAVAAACTEQELAVRMEALRAEYEGALASDRWISDFPGRRILKRFVGSWLDGVAYETFRNAVIDKLASDDVRPEGMRSVLDRVLDA